MKKEKVLLYIELSIGLQYIQEIGRPYLDILWKKIIEKIIKFIKKGKNEKNRKNRNRTTLFENRKEAYLGTKIYLGI